LSKLQSDFFYRSIIMNYSFSFKKILVCFILFSTPFLWRGAGVRCQNNNVGIGTVTPAPSALLDLTANDRGFLTPRITDTNLIVSPETGLLIYLTTNNEFYYYNGTFWQKIAGGIGIIGYTGATGIFGVTGITGYTGNVGSTGNNGSTGTVGATGNSGEKGSTGATGSVGLIGNTGSLGTTGEIGITGATGNFGLTGATGTIGLTGSVGNTGSVGSTGSTGPGTICSTATTNYVTKFTGTTDMCNSIIYDNGTNVGIGTITPGTELEVIGTTKSTGFHTSSGSPNLTADTYSTIITLGLSQAYIIYATAAAGGVAQAIVGHDDGGGFSVIFTQTAVSSGNRTITFQTSGNDVQMKQSGSGVVNWIAIAIK
jgi:hypothetical protein